MRLVPPGPVVLSAILAPMALFIALLAAPPAPAQQPCYADYRASRGDPLELQYGVAEVRGPCTVEAATAELGQRLAADGWQLLAVASTFGPDGLEARRESAGEFFLRY